MILMRRVKQRRQSNDDRHWTVFSRLIHLLRTVKELAVTLERGPRDVDFLWKLWSFGVLSVSVSSLEKKKRSTVRQPDNTAFSVIDNRPLRKTFPYSRFEGRYMSQPNTWTREHEVIVSTRTLAVIVIVKCIMNLDTHTSSHAKEYRPSRGHQVGSDIRLMMLYFGPESSIGLLSVSSICQDTKMS